MQWADLVDSELRDSAALMARMSEQLPPLSLEGLAARRAMMAGGVRPTTADVAVASRRIPHHAGGAEVSVLVINGAPGPARRPCILHFHGGGFVTGAAAGSAAALQATAAALDCTVVSVDYVSAPEARYDEAVEQDYSALVWIHRNAAELGVDTARVAVMGESSGGGHAALLAIAARDRGAAPICFLALTYPMLDDRTGSTRQMPPHLGAFGWDPAANRFGWECFLGQAPGTDAVPAAAAPARVESVAGLPPTFIAVGGLDLFVDEDIVFARRLIEAGVPTELLVVPGAFHGFDLMAPESGIARRFAAARLDALRRALAPA